MKTQTHNDYILRDWTASKYQKKSDSLEDKISKMKRMRLRTKIFEAMLVFNTGFLFTALVFTIFFHFEKDIVAFTLWIAAIFFINVYSYRYTKKEYLRIKKGIYKKHQD